MSKQVFKVREGAASGYPGFLGWLSKVHPKVYAALDAREPDIVEALEKMHSTGSTLMGDGEEIGQSKLQQFVTAVTQSATAILPLIQQQKMLKIQLQRAQAGQPPLDVGAYTDPNQGLNVGLNPGTQKTLLYLGLGVGAAILLSQLAKAR